MISRPAGLSALAGGLLAAIGAIGLASGFDPGSAAGALAIVGCFECGLIIVSLLVLVLGT